MSISRRQHHTRGYITISVIVFGTVFAVLLAGLTGFIFVQNRAQIIKENREVAIQIAEAGLDYYTWYDAHGLDPGALPSEVPYSDPEGGQIGAFSLEINDIVHCGETTATEIVSTGWTLDEPNFKRVVSSKFVPRFVSGFAFLLNSDTWFRESETVNGRVLSNGGIHMDGVNESLMRSKQTTWNCSPVVGCNPPTTGVDGIFGSTTLEEGANLWEFPFGSADFTGLNADLSDLKDLVDGTSQGHYFDEAAGIGYHIEFLSDGSFDLYNVTATENTANARAIDTLAWQTDRHKIKTESFLGNYDIDPDCGVIFVEDRVLVDGVINGQVMLAAADFEGPTFDPDAVINGDITYLDPDGDDRFALFAEDDILLPLHAPDDLTLHGSYIAAGGYFGMNFYPSAYDTEQVIGGGVRKKTGELTIYGSIMSNTAMGNKWFCNGSGSPDPNGTYCSGYATRTNAHDLRLASDPAPLTPNIGAQAKFSDWREVE